MCFLSNPAQEPLWLLPWPCASCGSTVSTGRECSACLTALLACGPPYPAALRIQARPSSFWLFVLALIGASGPCLRALWAARKRLSLWEGFLHLDIPPASRRWHLSSSLRSALARKGMKMGHFEQVFKTSSQELPVHPVCWWSCTSPPGQHHDGPQHLGGQGCLQHAALVSYPARTCF